MTSKWEILKKVEQNTNHLFKREVDFTKIFDIFKKGFPSFWDEKGNFIPDSKHKNKLMEKCQDHSTFRNITYQLQAQTIYDLVGNYFNILYILKKHYQIPSPYLIWISHRFGFFDQRNAKPLAFQLDRHGRILPNMETKFLFKVNLLLQRVDNNHFNLSSIPSRANNHIPFSKL